MPTHRRSGAGSHSVRGALEAQLVKQVARARQRESELMEVLERERAEHAETQLLLFDMGRRHQEENAEHLAVRATQSDIIARAMQVMSEYETIVRSSEENSLSRLAHHMETFEAEWVRRSKDLDLVKTPSQEDEEKQALDQALAAAMREVSALYEHQKRHQGNFEDLVATHEELERDIVLLEEDSIGPVEDTGLRCAEAVIAPSVEAHPPRTGQLTITSEVMVRGFSDYFNPVRADPPAAAPASAKVTQLPPIPIHRRRL